MIVSPGSAVLHAVWAVSLLAACSNAVLLRDSPALRLRGGLDASPASVVIRKPEIDKRTYRHVVLPNKLQAVLVSDTSAHAGAAALCVAAGQLDDPPEVASEPKFSSGDMTLQANEPRRHTLFQRQDRGREQAVSSSCSVCQEEPCCRRSCLDAPSPRADLVKRDSLCAAP